MRRLISRKELERLQECERLLGVATAALETASQHNQQIEAIVANRAALVNIERNGKLIKFLFVRKNEPFVIETYGTMSDDLAGWKKALLS